MKKKIIIIASVCVSALIFSIWFLSKDETRKYEDIYVKVKKGKFDIKVTTTGELQAENSEKIYGPSGLRKARIYVVQIIDLVPEGTVVDSGDYVGALDRSEIADKLKQIEESIEELETRFLNKQLDTTIQLSNLRDQLLNKQFELEEKEIELDQSKFEPPATIRQKEINLKRAERNYNQAVENYKLKEEQARSQMLQEQSRIDIEERKKTDILEIIDEFIIKAPSAGMVIYKTERDRTKRKIGSQIGPYDPEVATLPDFSSLISITYINEIDFNKIEVGQKVTVGVDAYPDKSYSGKIVSIANIGEQIKGSDAKVFEAHVKLNEIESILRPSMTTSNSISTASFDSVLYIPLDALYKDDSLTYVYKKDKELVRQIVLTGDFNDDEIIIQKGLAHNDVLLISKPPEDLEVPLQGQELIPEIHKKNDEAKNRLKNTSKKKKSDVKKNRKAKTTQGSTRVGRKNKNQ